MATTKTSQNTSVGESLTPCQKIQRQLKADYAKLDMWQAELNAMLGDRNSSLDEISKLQDILAYLNQDLVRLKAEKRKNNCPEENTSGFATDNQTILSTSSVRRKDRFALAKSDVSVGLK